MLKVLLLSTGDTGKIIADNLYESALSNQLVLESVDGLHAISEKYHAQKYDIILLDIISVSTQKDVINYVLQTCIDVPVIVISDVANESLKVKYYEMGAQEFLVITSVTPETLANHITYAIARKKNDLSFQEYSFLFQNSEEAIYSYALDGTINSWNKACERLYGYQEAEILGKNIDIFVPQEFKKDYKIIVELLKKDQRVINHESVILSKYGEEQDVSLSITPIKDRLGNITGGFVTSSNISQRKLNDQIQGLQYRVSTTLEESLSIEDGAYEVLKTLCSILQCPVGELWSIDGSNNTFRCVEFWSFKNEMMLLKKKTFDMVLSLQQDLPGHIYRSKRPMIFQDVFGNGQYKTELIEEEHKYLNNCIGIPIIFKEELFGVMLFFTSRNLSRESRLLPTFSVIGAEFASFVKRKRAERDLLVLSERDYLTSLYNRNSFIKKIEEFIIKTRQQSSRFALLYIDLDNFKFVNDLYSHEIGDKLLIDFAARLRRIVRFADVISRMGGDEFALLVPDVSRVSIIERVANDILSHAREKFNIHEDVEIGITVSIGVSIYPDDGTTSMQLLDMSDMALHQAKKEGKNRYKFCSLDIINKIKQEELIESSIKNGLENNEFFLCYQPIISSSTHKVTALEALIRWNHPTLGLLMPTAFINIAEKSYIILRLGAWVMKQALQDLRLFQGITPDLCMSINVAAKQIEDSESFDEMLNIIQMSKIEKNHIILEIVESGFIKAIEHSAQRLTKLKEIGVKIAIDDFGTGYSNFTYLMKFNIDYLKVDKSFTDGVVSNVKVDKVVQAIFQMAKTLGITLVAEGVSEKAQAEYYKQHQCDEQQGYYYKKPAVKEDIMQFLVANNNETR